MAAFKLSGDSTPQDVRAGFSACHARILAVCDELEEFADALPNRLDAVKCRRLAAILLPLLTECHEVEEQCVQHVRKDKMPSLSESIGRLRSEHRRDRYFAEDIVETLRHIGDTEPIRNPEAVGFMLRSFFETQRRHISFEREQIVPALTLQQSGQINLPWRPDDPDRVR